MLLSTVDAALQTIAHAVVQVVILGQPSDISTMTKLMEDARSKWDDGVAETLAEVLDALSKGIGR